MLPFSKKTIFILAGLGAAFAVCCQTYDFQPIEPLGVSQITKSRTVIARRSKPDLMLVVDKSGSMGNPDGGPSRWSELQTAMTTFLNNSGNTARMGMVTFPTDKYCGAPTEVRTDIIDSDDDSALIDWAGRIKNDLLSIGSLNAGGPSSTGGGTPTAETIRFLGNYSKLNDPNREDIVLLLTDGLPNCNTRGRYSCAANTCTCTVENGCSKNNCDVLPDAGVRGVSCLDKDSVVEEISALRAKQIRTIVVGFGADIIGSNAFGPLNAMAEAGGLPLECPSGTDAECGSNNQCDVGSKTCKYKYYQAQNAAELSNALAKISILITEPPCEYKLDEVPADPKFLSVLINGESVPEGIETWKYADGRVTFQGKMCARLENAQASNPINVEIRFIQPL